ncbi:hypothetical protein NL676_014273 [Syzygium grande]|nr:hypothetical protein NL676_014273 [Syzygium grande]
MPLVATHVIRRSRFKLTPENHSTQRLDPRDFKKEAWEGSGRDRNEVAVLSQVTHRMTSIPAHPPEDSEAASMLPPSPDVRGTRATAVVVEWESESPFPHSIN